MQNLMETKVLTRCCKLFSLPSNKQKS